MKLLFFDLETTGIDFKRCAIIQIGGIIVDIDTSGKMKPLDAIDLKMRPRAGKTVDQRALEVNNFSIDMIMSWQDDHEAYMKFIKFIEKYVNKYDKMDRIKLVGYNNAHFDTDYLREWFLDNGEKFFGSYFWSDQIDVMCEASRYLMYYRPIMNNFKLGNVATVMGIDLDKNALHDGMYDIKVTYKIFKKILESGNMIMPFDEEVGTNIFNQQKTCKEEFKKKPTNFTDETAFIEVK